jgi:transposase
VGASERDEAARERWRERVRGQGAATFVVVDECGSNTNLAPRYARAPTGERAYVKAPRNTEQNTTLIASMTTSGLGAAMTLLGATNRVAFQAYVEKLLAPSLIPGQVVVMDNLSAHKTERVRTLIEQRGCQLWFLPSYSPDLSPIEETFSKLKGILRKAEARSREALELAIAKALDAITPADAQAYLRHCSYGTTAQSLC